jgi:hypothetical protein
VIKKSVISLISYDADYLPNSIKSYYEYVDEIVLGLDKNRVSWSKNTFSFDEQKLWKELEAIDTEGKITIIEEDFAKSDVAIENDNYERNFLKSQCSHDWIFSFDADEELLNAREFFIDFLPLTAPYYKSADILMTWATPFKQIDDKILTICNDDGTAFLIETQGVITHKDNTFTWARWTNASQDPHRRIMSPLIALHWSLCRKQEDLYKKIHNIGHSDIAEKDPFYGIWSDCTLDNYESYRNFKTSGMGPQWPRLRAIDSSEIKNFYLSFSGKVY